MYLKCWEKYKLYKNVKMRNNKKNIKTFLYACVKKSSQGLASLVTMQTEKLSTGQGY